MSFLRWCIKTHICWGTGVAGYGYGSWFLRPIKNPYPSCWVQVCVMCDTSHRTEGGEVLPLCSSAACLVLQQGTGTVGGGDDLHVSVGKVAVQDALTGE